MTRAELLPILRATPDRVRDLAPRLSPSQLARRPSENEWSMGEVLNHLLAGERDVILPRLKRMLLEEAPVFPSSASTRSRLATDPKARDFAGDLAAFRRIREEALAYARYLAEHDLEHLAQLETTRGLVER